MRICDHCGYSNLRLKTGEEVIYCRKCKKVINNS